MKTKNRNNRYSRKKIILLLLYFYCISTYFHVSQSFAQLPSDSLIHYLEIAAQNNPTVLQRFSEYKAALQKVLQVGALNDPEFNAGVFIQPMELVEGRQYADFQLMQMFPWFGTLKAAKDEMSLMAKARYELFRDARLQVFYDVQRTWYELYKISKEKNISEKNMQLLKTIERLAIVRFKTASPGTGGSSNSSYGASSSLIQQSNNTGSNGMQSMGGGQSNLSSVPSAFSSMQPDGMGSSPEGGSLSDLYRIQIEMGELGNNIALLETLKNTVQARFNSYLNRPVEMQVDIPDTLVADTLNISHSAIQDSVLKNNPMLGMLWYEQQSIDARQRMATRMGLPMFGVGVDYSLIGKSDMSTSSINGKDMIMPMVRLTLPVYRQKYNALKKEADLLKIATSENLKATANSLQAEYYQALQLYLDSKRRINLYSSQLQLARKTLDLMLVSFSTSGGSLTDILRIRQQTLDYELKSIEAVADLNTGTAWIKRLMAVNEN